MRHPNTNMLPQPLQTDRLIEHLNELPIEKMSEGRIFMADYYMAAAGTHTDWSGLPAKWVNQACDLVDACKQELGKAEFLKTYGGALPDLEEPATAVAPTSALDVQVAGDHYKSMKIQPVEFIHANNIPFLEACVIKRICRWRKKDGIQDLEKAKHEINLLIQLETSGSEK